MTRVVPLSLLVAYTLLAVAPLHASHSTPHACHETGASADGASQEAPATGHGHADSERQPTPGHHHEHGPEQQPDPAHHHEPAPEQQPDPAPHHDHGAPGIEASEASSAWSATGRYLDTCRCNAPCPCHFGVGKDYDTCDPALVYQVAEGRFEGTRLDGLTVAVVATPRFARIYLDDRADEAQARGLETLARHLTGSLLRGGFTLAADQTVTRHPIHATLTDDRADVAIPGILEIAAERLTGGDGANRIVVRNMDLGPSWMDEVWAGRSVSYRYQDAAAWEYSGRNAYFGRFSAEGPAAPAEAGAPGQP